MHKAEEMRDLRPQYEQGKGVTTQAFLEAVCGGLASLRPQPALGCWTLGPLGAAGAGCGQLPAQDFIGAVWSWLGCASGNVCL